MARDGSTKRQGAKPSPSEKARGTRWRDAGRPDSAGRPIRHIACECSGPPRGISHVQNSLKRPQGRAQLERCARNSLPCPSALSGRNRRCVFLHICHRAALALNSICSFTRFQDCAGVGRSSTSINRSKVRQNISRQDPRSHDRYE